MGTSKLILTVFLFIIASFGISQNSWSQDEIHIPQQIDRVTDYVDVITADVEADLNDGLSQTESNLGLNVLVLTLATTRGVAIDEYGAKVLEAWGIDKQNKNAKTLLFVLASDDGVYALVRTAGLDSILSDEKLKIISDEVIMPQFINRNIEAGIVQGINSIIDVYTEGLRTDSPVHTSSGPSRVLGVDLLGIGIVLGAVLLLALIQLLL